MMSNIVHGVSIADALSRLPSKQTDSPKAEVFFFSCIDELPISPADISQATRRHAHMNSQPNKVVCCGELEQ